MRKLFLSAFGGFSISSIDNVTQSEGNQNQSIGNNSEIINSSKIHHDFLLDKYPNNNDTIPAIISSVNTGILSDGSIPGNTGDTIATPNQNTEKSIRKSAITDSKTDSLLDIDSNSNTDTNSFQSSINEDNVLRL